ncbi:MAG: site-specific DNA-methyltransferase [bacterium]|nr:site-specific DNA-methyltransferase [bacterium]
MANRINAKEYETWSKEELIKEMIKIKSTTYGLVWHRDLPEEKIDILVNPDARTPSEMFPNEMVGKPFPVLKEVVGKAIESDKSKLVNLLIEGDNYHSLAVLNFTHREAIDLIYIDPPYNTGNNDFIYNDKFVPKEDSFRHSKWLSFIEKRLKLAKNLLKPDGLIFISINDVEQAPLRMLCDEIFGEINFVANLVWANKEGGGSSDSKFFRIKHEYILVYSKDIEKLEILGVSITNEERYTQEDKYVKERGKYYLQKLNQASIQYSTSLDYPIETPDGIKVSPKQGNKRACWRWSKDKVVWGIKNDFVVFKKDKEGKWQVYTKQYMFADNEGNQLERSNRPFGIIDEFSSIQGTKALESIFHEKVFDYPKPLSLIKYLIKRHPNKDATVLDFMAGSGTTGHAVLELNREENTHKSFILCTNNGDEKSKHKIASDVCYPRIKSVIKGYKNIKGENVGGLGGNLKYYTTDFVEAEPTDKNKRKLVKESTDMLCILENAFELVRETEEYKIFKNTDKYVGVIFYEEAIDDYKKAIKKIDGHFNTYVFSMGDDPHTRKFVDVNSKVTLCAIPEVIMKVYREIFK